MEYEALKYIDLDRRLIDKLRSLTPAEEAKVLKLSKRLIRGNVTGLLRQNAAVRLSAALKAAENTLLLYRNLDIDEEIYRATMDDIRIWCENFGNAGLHNIDWIKNHISCNLFKIGRLQYQMFRYTGTIKTCTRLPLRCGEKSIYIHIPQGEKLYERDCITSIETAGKFFAKYFTEHNYKYYFCQSWLLYENNRDYMQPDSNIVKFMNLFDIRYSAPNERQALERIFNLKAAAVSEIMSERKRLPAIERLPDNTSLQRAAKSYMLGGGRLGYGIGIIDKNKFDI